MKRQDRSSTFESVEIPVSVLSKSDLAGSYLPVLKVIADAELKKMGKAGRKELERREQERAGHVRAGRVVYIYQTTGFNDHTIWVASPKKKGKERDKRGHLIGHSVSGPHEGKRLALMMLEREDLGGVVYVEGDGRIYDSEVVDLRPSECEALLKTGQHDWFYVPTGDDCCRSCGLVS